MTKEGTVYWGKTSRRWTLKAYCKGDELEAAKHQLSTELAATSVPAFADDLLRVELTLRGMELKELGLDTVARWCETTPQEMHSGYLAGLQISEGAVINAETLTELPGRLQLAYNSWREGHDFRQLLPRSTFYRYRRELLDRGVDIALVRLGRKNPRISYRCVLYCTRGRLDTDLGAGHSALLRTSRYRGKKIA